MATFYAPAGFGVPMAGDQAYFYNGNTTTPATVYEDSGLTDPLGTSATADSNGGWPNIYLTDAIIYRVKIIRAGGSLSSPLKDIYPLNSQQTIAAGSITAVMLDEGVAIENLGFTPVNKAGDSLTGDLLLTGAVGERDARSVGLQGAGQNNVQNGAYTFALADIRRVTKKTTNATPTWTIPPFASVGFIENDILIIQNNNAAGNITIARGAGVSLRANGSSTDEDKTLLPLVTTTLVNVGLNSWVIT